MVEAAGIDHAKRRIRDHAAAGLLKSYALMTETTVNGSRTCVRDGALAADLWRRMVDEDADDGVWTGDTIRLAASAVGGGMPAVSITGVRFRERDIERLIDHHQGTIRVPPQPETKAAKSPVAENAKASSEPGVEPPPPFSAPAQPGASIVAPPIPPGALLASVKQTMAATGFGRTKVNAMMKDGTLKWSKVGHSTRIEVASIMALADRGA
jgi:hypothetical protein